jgi:hypothetical protein
MRVNNLKTKSKSAAAVVTPPGIASYAFVWKPQPSMNPGQEPKFSITLLLPKKSDLSALKKAVDAAATKKFGEKGPALLKSGRLKSPFRDGDEERPDDKLYTGKIFFSARSNQAPKVVDESLQPIMDQFEFYSGCQCRISVYAFGYDVNGNKGVSFSLNNVQKLGDGERLSGRLSAEEEFGDSSLSSDDDDFLS